ncbi:(Fe-S)-binding protein [Lysobacter niabensis]|uniref:(Fe-S)-binding protein n=1 Tax=Agrilutibacter niabensis TaxID=380628 RepID=UPI003617FDCF
MPPAPSSPPAAVPDRLLALADRCVQCGLCLPACPTYGLGQTEAESPRGRIALARAWALGTIEPTVTADGHLDHCLGCRNCEAVCPAGVQYGELLVEARAHQRTRRGAGWKQALVEWLSGQPRWLDATFGLYRRLFPVLPRGWRRLPRPLAYRMPSPLGSCMTTLPESVALFIGCIARPYEPALREAVIRLCNAAGVRVEFPAGQTCCGALHAHAGNTEGGQRLAATNRAAFSGCSTVLTLASGCHEAVGTALSGTAATADALAFLHQRAENLHFGARRERIALHLPCTQRNVAKSVPALRALLARVPGLDIVELTAGYGCCGAAGTQMLHDATRAAAFRQPLVEQFERSGATRLLSANIGCRLHLANATPAPVQHPLEFLAACLDRAASTPPKLIA